MLDINQEIIITGSYSGGGEIRLTRSQMGKPLYAVEWRAVDSEKWSTAYMGKSFAGAFKKYRALTQAAISNKITFNRVP